MRRLRFLILVLGFLSLGLIEHFRVKHIAWDSFEFGLMKANESYTKCRPEDNSKEIFPEYFKACSSLCQKLYKEIALCVSSIDGGSVTCVCEQKGLK